MYLCDVGRLLDREFELSNSEQQFFEQHRYYDFA